MIEAVLLMTVAGMDLKYVHILLCTNITYHHILPSLLMACLFYQDLGSQAYHSFITLRKFYGNLDQIKTSLDSRVDFQTISVE